MVIVNYYYDQRQSRRKDQRLGGHGQDESFTDDERVIIGITYLQRHFKD
jgi:hypothetical protein